MTRIYLVVYTFNGLETTIVCATFDEAIAQELAGKLGSDGSVESTLLLSDADDE